MSKLNYPFRILRNTQAEEATRALAEENQECERIALTYAFYFQVQISGVRRFLRNLLDMLEIVGCAYFLHRAYIVKAYQNI